MEQTRTSEEKIFFVSLLNFSKLDDFPLIHVEISPFLYIMLWLYHVSGKVCLMCLLFVHFMTLTLISLGH